MKLDLAANLRDTRMAETLREEWKWKIVPEGEDEQLVLFNHAATTGEIDWEDQGGSATLGIWEGISIYLHSQV